MADNKCPEELKKSPEELKKLAQEMREWLNTQSHLPKDNIDDKLLIRFVHSCYYDVEKAKQAAELFFTLRSSAPDILTNRDPESPEMKNFLKHVNIGTLKISGNRNLWLWQLNDPGLENYDYLLDCRLFFLSTDAWLLEEEYLEEADVVILDVKDLSLKFLTKFNLSLARKCSKYQEDAMPIRLKQIHLINAPSVIDKVFALIKPFLKQEMTSMFHFHPPKAIDLLSYFTVDDLPKDYGGNRESMKELMVKSTALLTRQRERLIDDRLWKTIDVKKSNNNNKADTKIQKQEDSFRKLAID